MCVKICRATKLCRPGRLALSGPPPRSGLALAPALAANAMAASGRATGMSVALPDRRESLAKVSKNFWSVSLAVLITLTVTEANRKAMTAPHHALEHV